jgi:hypothetical protein
MWCTGVKDIGRNIFQTACLPEFPADFATSSERRLFLPRRHEGHDEVSWPFHRCVRCAVVILGVVEWGEYAARLMPGAHQTSRDSRNAMRLYFGGRSAQRSLKRNSTDAIVKHMKTTAIVVAILVAAGCIQQQKSRALINDVSLRQEMDSGYTVVKVDGQPVERVSGKVMTMLPCAIVAPGTHSITVRPKSSSNSEDEDVSITATFAADKSYRIASNDGQLSIIEHFREIAP